MARLARVVIPGVPHHIVQRGNRRQKVFFNEADRVEYLKILRRQSFDFGLKIWAYCLMDNHVHMIVVPEKEESLARGIGETNRLYTRRIHFREGWKGYLWQGRFGSYPLDEMHLYNAVRYVERNPVRARIVKAATEYRWSSARSHKEKIKDELLDEFYLINEIHDWNAYLEQREDEEDLAIFRSHEKTGRPLGGVDFIRRLERVSGRILQKRKPGPKGRN